MPPVAAGIVGSMVGPGAAQAANVDDNPKRVAPRKNSRREILPLVYLSKNSGMSGCTFPICFLVTFGLIITPPFFNFEDCF
jgi:hypothetical protein